MKQTPRVLRLVWSAFPLAAAALLVLTIVSAPLPAFFLVCGKKVIDGVSKWMQGDAAVGKPMVVVFLAIGLGINVVLRGLEHLRRFMEHLLNRRLEQLIQSRILDHASKLDVAFFETPSFYDKLQRAQRDAGFRPYAILASITNGGAQLATLCWYVVVLATLSWWAVPYVLLFALPGLFAQAKYGHLGWVIVRGRTPEERRMRYYQHLLSSDAAAKEMRLFALPGYFSSRWLKVFWKFYRQDRKLAAKRGLAGLGTSVLRLVGGVGFYVFVILRTISDPAVTIGSLLMYTQAMERTIGSVETIVRAVATIYENNLYITNLFEFLEQKPRVLAPPEPVPVPSPARQGLRFESVCFRYPGAAEDVLHQVSLEIRAGEKVAIVGENGAGKTTLIKLLARLYDPQAGRIMVDGIDLRQLDPAEWQQRIGIIFQDFVRYHLTARENVGFGQLAYVEDMKRIREAADSSGATESVEKLDHGELSVGEWQKIALARAFLRDAEILVLDEPTAALDAKREYEIFARFSEISRGKTTVLISHRFSTVRMADRIFVMDQGRIVESGSHDELIKLDGKYADLYNRQASAYR
jgi:ATP-binding cassette subfamily B protein